MPATKFNSPPLQGDFTNINPLVPKNGENFPPTPYTTGFDVSETDEVIETEFMQFTGVCSGPPGDVGPGNNSELAYTASGLPPGLSVSTKGTGDAFLTGTPELIFPEFPVSFYDKGGSATIVPPPPEEIDCFAEADVSENEDGDEVRTIQLKEGQSCKIGTDEDVTVLPPPTPQQPANISNTQNVNITQTFTVTVTGSNPCGAATGSATVTVVKNWDREKEALLKFVEDTYG